MKSLFILTVLILINLNSVFSQDLAIVREDDLFGYIDRSGNYAIEPQFERATSFSGNRAAATDETGKWGYIDRSGKWAIAPQYKKVKKFDSGIALVLKEDQWNYIDVDGKILETPPIEKYYDFENGAAIYRKGSKSGFINANFKIIVEPIYDEVFNFKNGYAKVRNGDNWGLIDKAGNIFVSLEYLAIGNYHENGLWAKKEEVNGVIIQGNFVPVANADRIWDFHDDSKLARARNDSNDFGFINNKGEWVIPPIYKWTWDFNEGLAPAAKGNKWGYINEEGTEVIPFIYKDAERFGHSGLAPVSKKKYASDKENWGFVNKEGKLVIPMDYALTAKHLWIGELWVKKGFIGGVARVKLKKKWGYLTSEGKVLGNKWYVNAEYFVDTSK